MTWTTIDGTDIVVLYALAGQSIEAVIADASGAPPTVAGSSTISARVTNASVAITGTPSGVSVVSFGKAKVIVVDKHTALSFWNPRLLGTGATLYDAAPDVPSVLVAGPYLVRNATVSGMTLELFGDLNQTTTIDVIAPAAVKTVLWNGAKVTVAKSNIGTLRGQLSFGLKATIPSLKSAIWSCADSLPEIQAGFDDSAWVTANKTSTLRPYQPTAGKVSHFFCSDGHRGINHCAPACSLRR